MEDTQEIKDEKKSITVQVYGHVQGVFFRDWTTTKAADLNIMGWVRNRVDHRVELHLEGLIEDVDFMVRLLKRGNPKSQVEGIMVDEAPFIDFKSFEIKDTV
jgi:acylphosphatase